MNKGIYKRKDGRWEARYLKGYNDKGRAIYGSVYGYSEKEVLDKKKELIGEEEITNITNSLNLLILGAGAHGKDVKELAENLRVFEKIKFLDDINTGEDIIGKCKDAVRFKKEFICAFVAIGDPKVRKRYIKLLKECNYIIPKLISPLANISVNAKLGEGVVIFPQATVNDSIIGDYCILASNSMVGSNSTLGEYSHIDCGSIIPRNVKVPSETWLNIGKAYNK